MQIIGFSILKKKVVRNRTLSRKNYFLSLDKQTSITPIPRPQVLIQKLYLNMELRVIIYFPISKDIAWQLKKCSMHR